MVNSRRRLLGHLLNYAFRSQEDQLDNCRQDEGLLSALVNLVDTVRDNPNHFNGSNAQASREQAIVEFLLAHHGDDVRFGEVASVIFDERLVSINEHGEIIDREERVII